MLVERSPEIDYAPFNGAAGLRADILPVPYNASFSPPVEQPFGENAPIVSMDIRLGKKYDFVDFDYSQFDEEADRLGLKDEDRSNLRILVEKRKFHHLLSGEFLEGITVRPGEKPHKTLVRELKHYADVRQEGLTADNRYFIGWIALGSLIAEVPLSIAASVGYVLKNNIAKAYIDGPLEGILAASALALLFGYRLHPLEKRARQAANQSQTHILTFNEKPRHQRLAHFLHLS